MIKKKKLAKLTYISLVLFTIFILSSISYFFLKIQTSASSIKYLLNILNEKNFQEILKQISFELDSISGLITIQTIFSLIIIISLISLASFLFKAYLVKHRNSIIDPLTGIYNRGAIKFGLQQSIKESRRYKHPLSLAILDIDHFKTFNDKNGHTKGDNALIKFSNILSNEIRESDILGRYGGEEFIIIFPETSLKNSKKICERIKNKIQKTSFEGEEKLPEKKLTTSIGLASFSDKRKSLSSLINEADKNLYSAKALGRNKIIG
ncbi:MAG: GGDEF domain-containing protein [Nanoarchaeota archaeon]